MKRLIFLGLVLGLCAAHKTFAQIPETLSYQAMLAGATGKALPDGQYQLTFTLYDTAMAGQALWTESQMVEVKDGIFEAILGSNNGLKVPFDKPYWLGIKVGSEAELTPRTRLTATAYSLHARTVADNAVTSAKIASGQVVKSINDLKDNVSLVAGNNVSIDQDGNTLKISAQGANGGDNGWTIVGNDVHTTVNGNVGIGKGAPTHKLHVLAPDANVLFESTTNGALFRLGTNEGIPNWVELLNRPGGNLAFSTGRMDQMVITRAGNVSLRPGVAPTRKFDVGGHLVLNTDPLSPAEAGGELVLANGDPLATPTWHIDHIPGSVFRIFHQTSINGNGTLALLATPTGDIGIGKNPQAKLDVAGTTRTQVLEITGGADLAEPFAVATDEAIDPGSVVIIDDANPGKLKLSEQAYDTRVAGIISGAGGVNPGLTLNQEEVLGKGHNVALTGRVYAKATAANGAIKPGGLLTTSDLPGHVMKATDRDQAYGTVLGKAMTGLETGEGLVQVLVNLQ